MTWRAAIACLVVMAGCGGGGGGGSKLCQACSSPGECDPGGLCITTGAGLPTFCGTDCSAAGATCPSGYGCVMVADGTGAIVGHQCAPDTSGVCPQSTGGGADAGTGSSDDLQFCV